MLLVLFTMVSARLDSIMLTMLFSGYNIDKLFWVSLCGCYHGAGVREVITSLAAHNNVYIRDQTPLQGCPAGWRVVRDRPSPLSDIAISIKFLAAGLAGWLTGWLAG